MDKHLLAFWQETFRNKDEGWDTAYISPVLDIKTRTGKYVFDNTCTLADNYDFHTRTTVALMFFEDDVKDIRARVERLTIIDEALLDLDD